MFSLGTPDFTPLIASVKDPSASGGILDPVSNEANIKLDVCFDAVANKATLKRVMYRMAFYNAFTTLNLTAEDSVVGLEDALFGQHEKLEMRLRSGGDHGLFIKGWSQDGKSFVTALQAKFQGDEFEPQRTAMLAGVLVNRDPFADSPCRDGASFRTTKFAMGTANFDVEMCTFQGAGMSTGYTFKKLTVTDSNVALPVAARAPIVLSGQEMDKVLKYQWNHHNGCDSFYLALPTASYGITTAGQVGCWPAVDGAPPRKESDQRPITLFWIKYGKKKWGPIQEMPRRHYLFNF